MEVPELKIFFATQIVLGINHTKDVRKAFSQNPFFANYGVQKILSGRRFVEIKNNLFFDTTFFLKEIQENWRRVWNISASICFDETIIPFKG